MKSRKADTVMLAVTLFCISGAILAYNLRTVSGGEAAVSLSGLAAYRNSVPASAISSYAEANLTVRESVFTSAEPAEPPRTYELLEPIIKPPAA